MTSAEWLRGKRPGERTSASGGHLQPPLHSRNTIRERECLSDYATMPLREIHRASDCALQWPQRPIGSLGEAKLVSPRDIQKVIPLIVSVLATFNSRGEFHEARKTAPEADLSNTG